MCGIFGCVSSSNNVVPDLISGLKKLEYRGYDSSGLAIIYNNDLTVVKRNGYIANLEQATRKLYSNIGIAHTRWSTHGKPTENNAHPHVSGQFALVHNGIIENFATLKEQLISKGYEFNSETDTEVIIHLLNHIYTGDLLQSLRLVSKLLIGTYALAVVEKSNPHTIIVTKKDSPLIVGKNPHGNYVSSDAIALGSICDTIYNISDEEFAVLEDNKITFYDSNLSIIEKEAFISQLVVAEKEADCVQNFMLKEILEIPTAIENTLAYYRSGLDKSLQQQMLAIEEIIIIGCGTAYHAGIIASTLIEKLVRLQARTVIASEFRYSNPIINKNTMIIAVSQSGETADTLACVKYAKNHPNKPLVCAITNVPTSTITKHCDYILPTIAGVEIAVGATKSYNTQLAVIYILINTIAKIKGYNLHFFSQMDSLKMHAETVLLHYKSLQNIASQFFTSNNVFFLGRSLDYATALEGSLKLKELAYLHSEGYPAGELKHGTLALIEENSLVVIIATQNDIAKKTINALYEVKARGAKVLLITQLSEYFDLQEADYILKLPAVMDTLMPILSIIPLQLLSYFMAIEKGNNPDKPRNLAKSVTVE